jgi:hypothetical protein
MPKITKTYFKKLTTTQIYCNLAPEQVKRMKRLGFNLEKLENLLNHLRAHNISSFFRDSQNFS